MRQKIIPTITTTQGSDWRQKIKELKELKLKEVAIFPTCINKDERQELYKLLKATEVRGVPLFHLRKDIEKKEVDYFIKNYKTKVFCIHSPREYPFPNELRRYRKMIFIENTPTPLSENEVKKFAGICLDFSHLEDNRKKSKDIFENNMKIVEKYPIGCAHISPVREREKRGRYSSHFFNKLSELDYLKNYPKRYFPKIIAIELANSIEEQLKIKNELKKLKIF